MRKHSLPKENRYAPSALQDNISSDSNGVKSKPPAIQFVSSSVNLMNQPVQLMEEVVQMQEEHEKVFGKHRAMVVNNLDPMHEKRLQIVVPAVLGENPVWAVCGNSIYKGSRGDDFPLPEVGADIYIEFEAGDPQYPIWF